MSNAQRRARIGLLGLLLLTTAPVASAQLLADVTLTTAIASDLLPGIQLPRGSFRAHGPGSAAFVAALPGTSGFSVWEVYTATGLMAALQPAFVRDVANAFAVAGMFEVERSETIVGGRTHTRIVFSDDENEALLYVIAERGSVTWAIGKKAR